MRTVRATAVLLASLICACGEDPPTESPSLEWVIGGFSAPRGNWESIGIEIRQDSTYRVILSLDTRESITTGRWELRGRHLVLQPDPSERARGVKERSILVMKPGVIKLDSGEILRRNDIVERDFPMDR